jgi:hypothetical protein
MKKNRLFLLGTGYPWYVNESGKTKEESTHLVLMSGPNRQEGRTVVGLKQKWGAWKKVNVWIEDAE